MDRNVKIALIIGGIVLAVLVIIPLVLGLVWGGQGYGYGMMGPGMMGGFGTMMGGYGTMGIMSIVWLVVLGIIIYAAVILVRGASQSGGSDSTSRADSSLEILKKRYARGEINKEEYEDKKKDLA